MNLLEQLKYQFKQGGMYIKLIYINVGIFIFFGLFTTLFELMMFKLQIDTFKNVLVLYTKPYELFTHPWGIISYMFLHHNFGHLFWNMLILFFVGRLFEDSLYIMLFWTHFIAINLFIGGWIVKDSQSFYINKILLTVPLVTTYLIGPIGLFVYWIIRIFYAKRISLYD